MRRSGVAHLVVGQPVKRVPGSQTQVSEERSAARGCTNAPHEDLAGLESTLDLGDVVIIVNHPFRAVRDGNLAGLGVLPEVGGGESFGTGPLALAGVANEANGSAEDRTCSDDR